MKNLKYFILLVFLSFRVSAEVSLPSIFADDMVLQQNSKNLIWGWAEPNERILIITSWGIEKSINADENGDWKYSIKTPSYRSGQYITINASNTIQIANVAIGEVWLDFGQSNMLWDLGKTYKKDYANMNSNQPNIRFFNVERSHSSKPDKNHDAVWNVLNNDNAESMSAVSYYFAQKLHKNLDVPVGILVVAFGGTNIETWMPKEIQEKDKLTSQYFDSSSELRQAYEKRFKYLQSKAAKNPKYLAKLKNFQPWDQRSQYPGRVYNHMINPILGYGIKGMVWYQGESNTSKVEYALNYENQLKQLIDYYRKTWYKRSDKNVNKELPFIFVQLPSWLDYQVKPMENNNWSVIRESMLKVSQDIDNAYMIVTIDTGDKMAIHPNNKKPVGERIAYKTLDKVYKKDIVSTGPIFKKKVINDNIIELTFDAQGGDLVGANKKSIDSFSIAGKDGVWYQATVNIYNNTVFLTSSKVNRPVAARYAWASNVSQRNLLYNVFGFPASPFRTDKWDITKDAAVNKFPRKDENYRQEDWPRPVMRP